MYKSYLVNMQTALETINDHYEVIINKDIDGICSKYYPSTDTYVILEGPRLTTIGFEKIKKGWTDFCASSITLESIDWIEGPFVEEQDNMAWVAGIINLCVAINNNTFNNTFRASFVLVKHHNQFLIKHEHVSIAHPDPYGIGDWSAIKQP
jgi:ketosteroid isomerase-like protein